MEDDSARISLVQWLGAWALAAGACCAPAGQMEAEREEKLRDNGKGEKTSGA